MNIIVAIIQLLFNCSIIANTFNGEKRVFFILSTTQKVFHSETIGSFLKTVLYSGICIVLAGFLKIFYESLIMWLLVSLKQSDL